MDSYYDRTLFFPIRSKFSRCPAEFALRSEHQSDSTATAATTSKIQGAVLRLQIISVLLLASITLDLSRAGPPNCEIPADYDTLQAAVDDPSCASIGVNQSAVAGDVLISRSVTVSGQLGNQSKILGQVVISGSGVEVALTDLHVDTSVPDLAGCFDRAVFVAAGAEVTASNVRMSNSAGRGSCMFMELLFIDSFE